MNRTTTKLREAVESLFRLFRVLSSSETFNKINSLAIVLFPRKKMGIIEKKER